MNSWRPKGWKKFNTPEELSDAIDNHHKNTMLVENQVFEAGAEAMYQPAYEKGRADLLEELKGKGNSRYVEFSKEWPDYKGAAIVTVPTQKKGYLVFIEE